TIRFPTTEYDADSLVPDLQSPSHAACDDSFSIRQFPTSSPFRPNTESNIGFNHSDPPSPSHPTVDEDKLSIVEFPVSSPLHSTARRNLSTTADFDAYKNISHRVSSPVVEDQLDSGGESDMDVAFDFAYDEDFVVGDFGDDHQDFEVDMDV